MKDLDNITQNLCFELLDETLSSEGRCILTEASSNDTRLIENLRSFLMLKTHLHLSNPSTQKQFTEELLRKVQGIESQKTIQNIEQDLISELNTDELLAKLSKDPEKLKRLKKALLHQSNDEQATDHKIKALVPKVILNQVEQLSKDSQIGEFIDENISEKDSQMLADKLSRHAHLIPELRQLLLLKADLKSFNTKTEDNFAELVLRKANAPDVTDISFDYIDENISSNNAIILEDTLSLFPEKISDLREQLLFKSIVSSLSDHTEHSLAPKVLEAVKEQTITPFPRKQTYSKPVVAAIAALICCLITVGILYKAPSTPAPVSLKPTIAVTTAPLPTPHPTETKRPIPVVVQKPSIGSFSNALQTHKGGLRLDQTLTSTTEDYHLTLEDGAIVNVSAPFKLRVISQKILKIEEGSILAECPTDTSQITILRDAYKIKDIGTKFSVDASKPETIIEVIEGAVEATYKNETKSILEGEAFTLTASPSEGSAFYTKVMPKHSPVDSNYFISSHSYNIMPISEVEEVTNPELAYLIHESFNLKSVMVDTTTSGITNTHSDSSEVYSLPTTDSGYVSYLLRTYPIGGDESLVTHSGSITFQSRVVGLMYKTSSLEFFEKSHNISYSDIPSEYTENTRGLEADSKGADTFNLSNDRRTLNFSLYTHSTIDDIRIILEK